MIRNKLDKPFGPFGTSTGFFLLIGGLLTVFFSPLGLLPVVIGAFIFLTGNSVYIDTDKRRVRNTDDVFGFIHVGEWIDIGEGMTLGLKYLDKGYRAYIKGTQPVDIRKHDLMIFLFNKDGKPLMPLKKLGKKEYRMKELENMSRITGLPLRSNE